MNFDQSKVTLLPNGYEIQQMKAEQITNLSQALDAAVARLPLLRRSVTQRRFRRNPEYRAAVLDELTLQLAEDPRAVEILGADFCEGLLHGRCTVDTAFKIEVDRIDNLERLLKLIVEYLPQILSMILRLFASVLLVLCLTLAASSTANAQHYTYPGTIQHHLQFDHGIDTRGLTQSQMLYLHDSLHESRSGYHCAPSSPAQPKRRLRLLRR